MSESNMGGTPFSIQKGVVPGSDGAKVREFRTGDRMLTTLMRDHVAGPLAKDAILSYLGAMEDGVLTNCSVYPQHGLVKIVDHLRMLEASTLSCAGLTAWTSLYGGHDLRPDDVVVTQGTGGVSLLALQVSSITPGQYTKDIEFCLTSC
ncbi:hypothetical protein NW762_003854 [Fusarium torreyae]|uniref:Uncharacterized protein n=1 Tax=Fusarium torreyae TaxID=1237075 RepID=A0A9W8VM28_9HYPO|nr:hypothetical protein NW762_003854 [Fusarium torreyae]